MTESKGDAQVLREAGCVRGEEEIPGKRNLLSLYCITFAILIPLAIFTVGEVIGFVQCLFSLD